MRYAVTIAAGTALVAVGERWLGAAMIVAAMVAAAASEAARLAEPARPDPALEALATVRPMPDGGAAIPPMAWRVVRARLARLAEEGAIVLHAELPPARGEP